jgi:NADPH:quinone reductase-like Zn-dependent oxidoreductase
MSWATPYIAKLQAGETVQFRPRGSSMQPKIKSGQLCTVEPLDDKIALREGDVVLCKVGGKQYLHLVKAIRYGGLYLIGNNRGHENGWVNTKSIYGRLVKVEP